jgi:hypothetical protein
VGTKEFGAGIGRERLEVRRRSVIENVDGGTDAPGVPEVGLH